MSLSVDEMKKSIPEKRDDGKISPKVGAVLVFPNGTYETAYRGELREGDHAEYTLLERKHADASLEECILFTTLEPCVVRNPPKRGCSRRITNARIKTVYVGIQDHDPTVAGEGIKYLEERGVRIIMYERQYQKIIEDENMGYLKQAKQRASDAKRRAKQASFKKGIPTYDFRDFSREALTKFLKETKLVRKVPPRKFKPFLADIGAMELDVKTNTFRPTGMGILLFGENPRAKYKQAVLKAHADYGAGKIEPADFDQPLVLVPDLLEDWLKKVIPLSKDVSKFKRRDVPDFPISVLREAVINALVHRDYALEGAKCSLEIERDKIVVKSPGAPLPSISLEQLNTFQAPSISRNPILTYVFSLMNYMEEKGFGMKTFRSLTDEHQLPLPEYTFDDPFLTLTFPRRLEAVREVSGEKNISKLTHEELEGFEWIKSVVDVSTKEYAEHFGYSQRTATRHLVKMRKFGLISANTKNLKSPSLRYRYEGKPSKHRH